MISKMNLQYVKDDWFVRSKVIQEVDENVLEIARTVFDREIKWYAEDPESRDSLLMAMMEFIDLSDYTFEELFFLTGWVNYYCALKHSHELGVLDASKQVPKKFLE